MKSKKILIVDDDAVLRQSLGLFLSQKDFEVIESEDGKVGFDMYMTMHPDIIILDMMMPNITGNEFIELVRKNNEKDIEKIIVMTNKEEMLDVADVISKGVTDYVTKSNIDLENIYGLILRKLGL
ncbi:MAG: response regulator [Patescibacteria group bacterium]